jgi:hypothetical protein
VSAERKNPTTSREGLGALGMDLNLDMESAYRCLEAIAQRGLSVYADSARNIYPFFTSEDSAERKGGSVCENSPI